MTIEQAIKRIIQGWYGIGDRQLLCAIGLVIEGHNPDEVVVLLDRMEQCVRQSTRCYNELESAKEAFQKAELECENAQKDENKTNELFSVLVARMSQKGVSSKIVESSIDEELAPSSSTGLELVDEQHLFLSTQE